MKQIDREFYKGCQIKHFQGGYAPNWLHHFNVEVVQPSGSNANAKAVFMFETLAQAKTFVDSFTNCLNFALVSREDAEVKA